MISLQYTGTSAACNQTNMIFILTKKRRRKEIANVHIPTKSGKKKIDGDTHIRYGSSHQTVSCQERGFKNACLTNSIVEEVDLCGARGCIASSINGDCIEKVDSVDKITCGCIILYTNMYCS
jgi:hypothetical protein